VATISDAVWARATTGGHAGMSALIATRMYKGVAAQESTLPYATQTTVTEDREFRAFGKRPQIITATIQIDLFAASAALAETLLDQAIDAFDIPGGGTWGGVTIQESHAADVTDDVDGLDSEGQSFRRTLEVEITYVNPLYV
jgi:hypothetical protein